MAKKQATKTTTQKDRRKIMCDGGVYLVVADGSEEFPVALRYATKMAEDNHGHMAILKVVNVKGFSHWGTVEDQIRKEIRKEGEKILWEIAGQVNEVNGMLPSFYLEEGDRFERLEEVVRNDPTICMIILAASRTSSKPGPLISYYAAKKGMGSLRVPLLIVPGDYERQSLDDWS